MNKESLEKTLTMIIENLDKMEINKQDKIELMINLKEFLQPEKYEDNIELLKKENMQHKLIYIPYKDI